MQRWIVAYEDRADQARTVESRNALDAAKDFALLEVRKSDCSVVVRPAGELDQIEIFDRVSGVFHVRAAPVPPPVPIAPPPQETRSSPSPSPSGGRDTHSYRGWLVSDRFLKRALAAAGYSAVGNAIVAVIVWTLVFGTLAGCFSMVNMFGQR